MKQFTLLNTRPAHQADALNELVVQQGGESINCPTIEIQWLAISDNEFTGCKPFDKAIFTSSNSVLGWYQSQQKLAVEEKNLFSQTEFYAIGKATQEKGLELGFEIKTLSQKQFDSEHFLAHEKMVAVKGQQIAIFKGVGGRSLIEETLSSRGATAKLFDIYQRKMAPFCVSEWERFLKSNSPVLLLSSLESWQNLVSGLLQENQNTITSREKLIQAEFWLKLFTTVVMSQRIADTMIAQGWKWPIIVVETQSNQGIVKAILKSVHK